MTQIEVAVDGQGTLQGDSTLAPGAVGTYRSSVSRRIPSGRLVVRVSYAMSGRTHEDVHELS
jgi:hypothetical protein